MFEQEVKKKSKLTSGVLILFGILFMSVVVIINENAVIETAKQHIQDFKDYKNSDKININ